MTKPAHLAILRLSAMGDVAMTVPVINALTQQYPELVITVVSRPFFAPFFASIPNVRFFAVDLNKKHKGILGILKLYLDLKKLDITLIADLHNVLRSKILRTLFLLSGKKVAATNKGRAQKKALTSPENKIFVRLKSMHQRHVDTLQKLGFFVNLSQPIFAPKPILSVPILSVTGTKQQNWIGIAPFAQYTSKVYPLDLMQQVIDTLAVAKTDKIFLFGGGKTETEQLHQLAKSHTNVTVLAGIFTLQQELQIIANLDLMLSMDSGNAHLAAMLGVNTITLWGATHPYAGFVPFNQDIQNCITANRDLYPQLPTSVYGNKIVKGYQDAMRTITPTQVVTKIKEVLKSS